MSETKAEEREKINDGCPEWAESLVWVMYDIEVSNGNIVGNKEWTEGELSKFHEKVFKNEDVKDLAAARDVDQIFEKVCKGLSKEGFSNEKISDFINTRLVTGSKLKYCDANEVKEAL